MALFLAQNSILKIMILGHWSSATFIKYIRPQVMEWTAGMSMSMLQSLDFRHADPALTPATQPHADRHHHRLTTSDIKCLQANLDVALETPEETTFNGSSNESTSLNQLNLEL
ncbi:hypothetical protein ACA910_021819 [Epithemia clementina (nom. ined.)]